MEEDFEEEDIDDDVGVCLHCGGTNFLDNHCCECFEPYI